MVAHAAGAENFDIAVIVEVGERGGGPNASRISPLEAWPSCSYALREVPPPTTISMTPVVVDIAEGDVHGFFRAEDREHLPHRRSRSAPTRSLRRRHRCAWTVPSEVWTGTTISGVSQRSISPSPSSSVRLPTTGVTTMLVKSPSPSHAHWTSGSKLPGGAVHDGYRCHRARRRGHTYRCRRENHSRHRPGR